MSLFVSWQPEEKSAYIGDTWQILRSFQETFEGQETWRVLAHRREWEVALENSLLNLSGYNHCNNQKI